ncbi:brix domain-containing protein peter pan [Haemaphysalis longicornis]
MGARKRKGRAVKAAKQGSASMESEELSKAPHTFVINRGTLGKNASELMLNFRKVMEPYTASRLKVRRKNVVKDFVSVAGLLHVTHLVVFTKTEQAIYLRLARLPRGPTLTFRVENYALARDVISSLKKPVLYTHQFSSHPLLVLNNFSGEGMHFKLMASMFQNMFPSINIHKVKLNTIRRCLLLNYNSTDETIDFRHYTIKVAPSGINRAVKKLVQSKVPNLGHLRDISEYVDMGGLSESEAELDGASNQVLLPQKIASRGNALNQQSAIRMVELGPRMKLKLVKIEEGLMTGEVMYHAFVQRSPEEIKALRARRLELKRLKEKRKREQELNKQRKEAAEEGENSDADADVEADSGDEDDDREWYRREVGEEPGEEDVPLKSAKAKPRAPKLHGRQGSQAGASKAPKKAAAAGEQGKRGEKRKLSDFEVMMQRRKKRKKMKEKSKEQRLRSQKVARLRAQQKEEVPFKKVKHKRSR